MAVARAGIFSDSGQISLCNRNAIQGIFSYGVTIKCQAIAVVILLLWKSRKKLTQSCILGYIRGKLQWVHTYGEPINNFLL